MFTRKPLVGTFFALALALTHGCADEAATDDSPDEASASDDRRADAPSRSFDELELVAEVPFENGGSLRYYEPEPGSLLTVDTGPAMRERLPNEDERSAAEVYSALTGEPAPDRLVTLSRELAEHATENVVPNEAAERDTVAAELVGTGQPIDKLRATAYENNNLNYDQFYSAYCANANWKRDLWVWPTRHRISRPKYYRFGIYSLQGRVRYDVYFDGNWWSNELPAGWFIATTYQNSGLFRGNDHETKATGVEGTNYVFSHCVTARN